MSSPLPLTGKELADKAKELSTEDITTLLDATGYETVEELEKALIKAAAEQLREANSNPEVVQQNVITITGLATNI